MNWTLVVALCANAFGVTLFIPAWIMTIRRARLGDYSADFAIAMELAGIGVLTSCIGFISIWLNLLGVG